MIAFAELLERLVFTPAASPRSPCSAATSPPSPTPTAASAWRPSPDELVFDAAKPLLIRTLAEERTDPVLFAMSHDYVGDLAETVALIWPAARTNAGPPTMTEVVQALLTTPKAELPRLLAGWLDASDASVRYALLKLITGSLRVGASARLAKTALAELAGRPCGRRPHRGNLARPGAALRRPVRLAGGPRRQARPGRRPRLPPAHAGPPPRSAGPRRPRPGGLPRRVEVGRHPRATGRNGGRQAASTPAAPTT